MRFERDYWTAVDKAKKMATSAASFLDTFANEAEAMAIQKAGLSSTPQSAQEIRAALRQMTPKDREKAVADAFERGDSEILASIYKANPLLWGGVKTPVDAMFGQYIDQANPERIQRRRAADTAAQVLGLATDGLLRAAEEWRDPEGAARGEAQEQQFLAAKERMATATRDYS
jgi:uncharacterized protein YgbK (DUF1537 family)